MIDRFGVGEDFLGFVRALAARAIAAEHVDRLRGQADVADDRDAAVGEEVDCRRHRLAALQLHCRAAGLLHDPRGAGEGLLWRAFIASKRHVDGDQAVPAAAHDRSAMSAHHFQRHRYGGGQPVNHLPQAVADQQDFAMRIEQLGHAHRVGGQHDERLLGLPILLAGTDCRNRHSLARHRRRRCAAGRRIDGESRHARPSNRSLDCQPPRTTG